MYVIVVYVAADLVGFRLLFVSWLFSCNTSKNGQKGVFFKPCKYGAFLHTQNVKKFDKYGYNLYIT